MEKDIITIKLADGTIKDMEVVLVYSDDKKQTNYILYKDIDSIDECYAAKYVKNGNLFEIDSNLSKEELTILECVLERALKENNHEN
ncbi:MAG: hypothetical protein IJE89_05715 [Bacilli bacterium]|nr:hypothetical protein [Bacilli bacterium]